MPYESYQVSVWNAGEVVPVGTYVRIDDQSYRMVILDQDGPLPASFDGHVALYRAAANLYTSEQQVTESATQRDRDS